MVMLKLDIKGDKKRLEVKDELLFNSYLIKYPNLIKKIIKNIYSFYKIKDSFFCILNGYIEFDDNGESLYPGLIVRVDYNRYAVLYLEKSTIDEVAMNNIIKEYIYDVGESIPKEINIDKFEVNEEVFLEVTGKF